MSCLRRALPTRRLMECEVGGAVAIKRLHALIKSRGGARPAALGCDDRGVGRTSVVTGAGRRFCRREYGLASGGLNKAGVNTDRAPP